MKVEELEKLIESLKEISKYTELDIKITINPSKDEENILHTPYTPYTPYNPWQYQPVIQPLSIPITWKTFSTDRITSTSTLGMYYFDKETNTYKLNED